MTKFMILCVKSLSAMMLLSLCCCSPHMQRFELSVLVDTAVTSEGNFPKVPVDIVGVEEGEFLSKFKDELVDNWFTPGNDLRHAAKDQGRMCELNFGAGLANPQSLLLTDPIWETWEKRNCKSLVVFASFPRDSSDSAQNSRRPFVIPLSSSQWDNPSKVQLTIRISEMLPDPQFKPVP